MGSIQNMTFDFTDPTNPILEFTSYPGSFGNRMLKEISFTVTKKNLTGITTPSFLTPLVANSSIIESIYTGSTSASNVLDVTGLSYNIYNSSQSDSIINSSVSGDTWVKISSFAGNLTTLYTKTRIKLNTLYGTGFETNKQYAFDVRFTETTGSGPDVYTWSWNYTPTTTATLLASNVDNYTPYIYGNTSDISLPPVPTEGADWGYQNIISDNGTALVLARILGTELAATSGVIKAQLQDGFGNTLTLPVGTRAMLVYSSEPKLVTPTSGDPYYVSPSLDTSSLIGGLTTGLPVDQITVTNYPTTLDSYITVGFALPVSSTGSNYSLQTGNTYNFLVRNSTDSITLVETTAAVLTCLYEDSEVLTPSGYVSVKQLQNGDLVTTSDGRTSRIINITKSKFPASENTSPIIIPANSIAENYPPKDCRISKYHMIQYNGNWIAPLKNKHIFKVDKSIRSVKYYHIQLENYYTDNLVINGGLIVESLGNGERDNTAEWDARVNNSIIL